MSILIFTTQTKEHKTLLDEIKSAKNIEEIATILRPFHTRYIFLSIISKLVEENKKLTSNYKQEEEIEII